MARADRAGHGSGRRAEAGRQGAARRFLAQGDEGFYAQIVRMPPGFDAPVHSHDHEEVFMVLEGSCTFDGEPMGRFDMTVVAANQPYGFVAGPEASRSSSCAPAWPRSRQAVTPRDERALRSDGPAGGERGPSGPARSAESGAVVHYDLIVRGGFVVDGTGLPRRRVDVGVRDGRVATMAHLDGATAAEEIDAGGMIVAPGIVDAHTHYDPQITFDPYATVSCFHGVTTVIAGNCGFSVAPCKPDDRTFLEGIFARVENMDPIALGAITWEEFETFPEFLASREGRLGVNFGCYVGHSNLRRWVMGPDASTREATAAEISEMRALLADAMAAGAAGVSSSAAPTHLDLDGRPVPSRIGARDELLALAEEAGAAGAGSIAFLPMSAIGGLDETDEDYLIRLSAVSGLPVVIQGLGGRNKTDAPTATWEAAESFLDRATGAGAPVYSILIARPFDRPVVLDETNFHYLAVPSWDRMLKLPHAERVALLRDPAARDELRDAVEHYNRDPAKGTTDAAAALGRGLRRRGARGRSTRSGSRDRSATSRASSAWRRPTRSSTSRSPRTCRRGSAGGPRARSGRPRCARRSSTRG